jgi:cell wall-associated NlpC family hydrolase
MKDFRNTESADMNAVGQYPRFRRVRQAALSLLLLAGLPGFAIAGTAAVAPAARAAVLAPAQGTPYFGDRMLNQAETRAGDWYQWAAAGPYTFDCSGLVVWAAGRLGRTVPHSTYSMLADSGQFYAIPVSSAVRGDLMFFGSGHVEIKTKWYHGTFGAQQTGTRVGWHTWSAYWQPTMALRWRG